MKVTCLAVSSKGEAAADSGGLDMSSVSLAVSTTVLSSDRLRRRRRSMRKASAPQRMTTLVTETMAAIVAGEMRDRLVVCGLDEEVGISIEVVSCDAGTLSPEIGFVRIFQEVTTAYLSESKNPFPFGLVYTSKRVNSSFRVASFGPMTHPSACWREMPLAPPLGTTPM